MESHLFNFIEQYIPLSTEEKRALIELDVFRSFEKGTVLLREGNIVRSGYFVVSGCLRSYYIVDGEERTTAFHTENDSLTPICGSDNSRSAHFISCVEDSIVTIGNMERGREVTDSFPRLEKLCSMVSEQLLTDNMASFADFKHSNPEQRYLNLLKTRPDLLQRVPQHQIASFLGMTPQSLSRIRRRLASSASLLT